MNAIVLLLGFIGGENEPAEIRYVEPPQIVWSEPAATELSHEPTAIYEVRYANGWTWPSTESIRDHLAGANHGLNPDVLSTLTEAQLIALHNSDHDKMLDRSSVGRDQLKFARLPSTSCPNGVCPTGPSVSRPIIRRGVFRRR